MAFCTHCGSPVEGAFCSKCGAKVEATGEPSATPPQPPSRAESPVVIPAPPAQAPKKGRFIFWALGGCLALIVIAIIIVFSAGIFIAKKTGFDISLIHKDPGLAVAKILATSNPDIEVVSVDEAGGIIRVRDKKTGKEMSMVLKDAKNGKIVFLDDQNRRVEIQSHGVGEGASLEVQSGADTVRMGGNAAGQLPDWLPSYPGAETIGVSTGTGMGNKESCTLRSKDSAEIVGAFYEKALRNAGFKVQRDVKQMPGQGSVVTFSASDSGNRRTANVIVTQSGHGTMITLEFEGR